ncbi:MAG: hypothetical protein V4609_07690 [Pseudomonadota bacterium]
MQKQATAATRTGTFFTRLAAGKARSLAIAATLCAAGAVQAQDVTPFLGAWNSSPLPQVQSATGHNSFKLAFGTTNGSCALNPYFTNQYPAARTFVNNGGQLTLSMGGADGIYAEIACNDDQLYAILDRMITQTGTRRIDWDVEGWQLPNTTGHARRARVLARLQQRYPDLYNSFTLPGWLRGLDSNSMALLRTTIAHGVRISRVNAMAMDFGRNNLYTMAGGSMSQAVIMTLTATNAQLKTLFPGRSTWQIYGMMGVTPMIGTNDDFTTFTLADAQRVAEFARQNGLGMISYWAFNRDRAQSYAGQNLTTHSGVVQSAYQYLRTFKSATYKSAEVAAPTTGSTSGSCWAANWTSGKWYSAGSIVTYNGAPYRAKVANPGYNPTISTYYWARHSC